MWMCNVDVRGKEKRKLQIVIDSRDRAVTFDLFSVSRRPITATAGIATWRPCCAACKENPRQSICAPYSVYPYR